MSNSSSSSSSGIGFSGLLTVVFITLKLTGYINWPWVWVLSPMWIPLLIAAVLLLVIGIVAYMENR
jgi:uncharacterized membrane protein